MRHRQRYQRRYDIRRAIQFLERMQIDVTMRNIARAIGMSPSTYLLKILKHMERDRYIIIRQEPYRQTFRNLYALTDRGDFD